MIHNTIILDFHSTLYSIEGFPVSRSKYSDYTTAAWVGPVERLVEMEDEASGRANQSGRGAGQQPIGLQDELCAERAHGFLEHRRVLLRLLQLFLAHILQVQREWYKLH
jgi:hypothetical protein